MLLNMPVRKGREKLNSQISVRGNILVRGNLHKCLACGGVKQLRKQAEGGFKLSGFYPKNKPYPHKEECTQKHLL